MLFVLLLVLLGEVCSKPSGLSKAAIEAFVSDGQLSEKELLLLKGRLRRLAAVRARSFVPRLYQERATISFSHDHEDVNSNENTEEAINQRGGLSEYLYQGDILLTPQQALRKLQTRTRRAALPPEDASFAKWNPERIGYIFDGSVPFDKRIQIEEVLNYYRERTCLRFVNQWPGRNDISLKFRMSAGCWSYVGRLPRYQLYYANGLQDIGFEWGCFNQFGTIAHEIMHALGFNHEHIRKDRDNYVVVNYRNIATNDNYNYDKDLRGDYQGFEYEMGSQMHYGEVGDVYNLNDAKLYARDFKQLMTIGNRMFPTFQDIAQINKYYNCYERCKNATTVCHHGGVPRVNNCSICECPHGFGGSFCTEVEAPTVQMPNCGGYLDALVGKEQTYTGRLKSEIWQKFMVEKCYWHIRAPEGRRVKVFVKASDLHCTAGCPWSAMEVKTGKFHMAGTRKCCTAGTSYDYYTSESNLLVVGLYTKMGEVSVTWAYSAV